VTIGTTQGPTVIGVPLTKGQWAADPTHSEVSFAIRHLGLSKVRGRFERFAATLDIGDTVADTRVAATVELASVNTNQSDRDGHLRSSEFFSVEQHPTLVFTSTAISGGEDDWQLTGDVTLNGRTNPVTLAVEFHGAQVHPVYQQQRLGFSATGTLKRSAFGIEFGLMPIAGDKLMLGDDVKLEIEIQFVPPQVEA
jgi:polyisoprenoid-binding protein YceI